ncbi:MAG: hypothetical protein ACOYYS_11320 [Chloroflexota bacterium]
MKCYNHTEMDAIGICKNCYKAICKQCAVPNEYDFVVCSAKCLEEAAINQKMMDKAKMAYGLKPGRLPVTIIFMLMAGLFFAVIGILALIGGSVSGMFMLGIGLIFIIGAILNWVNQKKSGIKV